MVSWSELYNAVYVFESKHMDALVGNVEREYAKAGEKSCPGLNRNKVIHFWAGQSVQVRYAKPQHMPSLDIGCKAFGTSRGFKAFASIMAENRNLQIAERPLGDFFP